MEQEQFRDELKTAHNSLKELVERMSKTGDGLLDTYNGFILLSVTPSETRPNTPSLAVVSAGKSTTLASVIAESMFRGGTPFANIVKEAVRIYDDVEKQFPAKMSPNTDGIDDIIKDVLSNKN